MVPWVATHADLHLSGLTPAACRPDARALGSIDTITGALQIDGHGFAGGEFVRFSLGGEPSPLQALPGGISAGRWYTVADTQDDPDFFHVFASGSSGPILVPMSPGAGSIYVTENYLPKIDRVMSQWTSFLIASAKAYKPPWYTPPTWAAMMVAMLAAPTVARVLRVSADRYDVAAIERGFMWAEERRSRLENGEPMDDGTGPVDSDPTVADIGSVAGNDATDFPIGATLWRTGAL